MPIHDWTRVNAGIFHDFHIAWLGELRKALNRGLLPRGYYALVDQIAGTIGPDVLTLQKPTPEGNGSPGDVQGAVAVVTAPPKVRWTIQLDDYLRKQRTLVIRHVSDHRLIALIEIVSPGNKGSRDALRTFLRKADAALAEGIHLLLVDLFPPGPRDPQGIHGAIWEQLGGGPYEQPSDKPLTLVAYVAGLGRTAYVEPAAVGDTLPDMPLFLTPEHYVNVPLEATYRETYEAVPEFYRDILEAPPP